MSNPALVEVVRSGFTESVHRRALVVTAPDGTALLSHGDVQRPVFVRSANKPLQAFGMLRAGLLIDDDELALACASHSGEPGHRRLALAMLARHGLHESALRCPPDYPAHEPSKQHVLRAGGVRRPAAMNCSGKHAAMLATCAGRGWSTFDYLDPAHELQRGIASTVAELAEESIAATGVDGCGAPLFAYSLTGLARAFGRLTSAASGPGRRIADAMRARAWLVGGTGRDDTLLMLAVDGLLTKAGAEGVHACALPDGTALALKIDDGAARARAPLLVAALHALDAVPERPAASSVLTGLAQGRQQVVGAGRPVGRLRVADDLFGPVQRRVRPVG